jgi:iron complex transport system substrate-binding protein
MRRRVCLTGSGCRLIRRRWLLCLAACFLALAPLVVSGAPPANEGSANEAPRLRLVSLAPSNTELVYSLGAGAQLVGVSESCDFPAAAQAKSRVGTLSSLKMEKIAGLHPDLVLLVSGQEALSGTLKKHGFATLILDGSSIGNVGRNLLTLGKVLGRQEQAARLAAAFELSIAGLRKLTATERQHPRVFICIWPQPLMSAGRTSFLNEGVTIAGGINCAGDLAPAYPRINPERLFLMHPDLILIPQELSAEKFWLRLPWSALRAVREKRVYVLPQHETDCLMRPTLRFVDAAYWLSVKLHPQLKGKLDSWLAETSRRLCE